MRQPDDRLSRVHEIGEMSRFALGGIAEAGCDDHEVGVLQFDQSDQSLLVVGVNVFSLLVPGEDDHAIESVMLTENFSEHRHDLLGAIFLVTSHQNDFLSLPGSVLSRQLQNLAGMVVRQGGSGKNHGQEKEKVFHGQTMRNT